MKSTGLIQTAKALKVPSEWLKKQAEDGLVPAIQFGSRWRFDVEAVRKNIENRLSKKEGNFF